MKIAETINNLRKRLGISQAELSKLSGVNQQYISQIELGNKTPGLDVINKIGSGLGLSGELLLIYSSEGKELNDLKRQIFGQVSEPTRIFIDGIIDDIIKEKDEKNLPKT